MCVYIDLGDGIILARALTSAAALILRDLHLRRCELFHRGGFSPVSSLSRLRAFFSPHSRGIDVTAELMCQARAREWAIFKRLAELIVRHCSVFYICAEIIKRPVILGR